MVEVKRMNWAQLDAAADGAQSTLNNPSSTAEEIAAAARLLYALYYEVRRRNQE